MRTAATFVHDRQIGVEPITVEGRNGFQLSGRLNVGRLLRAEVLRVNKACGRPRIATMVAPVIRKAVAQRLDRLVDALADGSLPADEIKTRLSTEKGRKTALTADLARLERLAKFASTNIEQIAQNSVPGSTT
jgi:hypothetical protein